MNSLRTRLLLATILVAAVAVIATALLSRRIVTTELNRFVTSSGPVALDPIAQALTSHLLATGTLGGADSILALHARAARRALILIGPDGSVTASSLPRFKGARVEYAPGGRMRNGIRIWRPCPSPNAGPAIRSRCCSASTGVCGSPR